MRVNKQAILTPDPDELQPSVSMHGQVGMLGHRIKNIVDQHGGCHVVAPLIGAKRDQVGRWCRGYSEPSAYFLRRLAHLGDVTVDFLLCDQEDSEQEERFVDIRRFLSDACVDPDSSSPVVARGLARVLVDWMRAELRYRSPKGE